MRTTLTAVARPRPSRRGHRRADHGGCPQRMVGPGHHRRPGRRSHHRKRLRKAVLRGYGYYQPGPGSTTATAPAYYGYHAPGPYYGCWRWRNGYRYRVC
jgi:hypothetical protein